jgi:hypothetical protein
MLRSLNEFNGDALLVGGGWIFEHTALNRTHTLRKREHFYTIDEDPNVEPDAVLDITDKKQCAILPDARFSLIYFEHFPLIRDGMLTAFTTARRLLKEDGILIYHGGSHIKFSSIPTLLNMAGFVYASSKKHRTNSVFNEDDNGSLTIASNMTLEQINANSDHLSQVAKHYLHYYKFLDANPFDPDVESLDEAKKYLLSTQGLFSTFSPKSQKSFCDLYKTCFKQRYSEDTSSESQEKPEDPYGSDSEPDCLMS